MHACMNVQVHKSIFIYNDKIIYHNEIIYKLPSSLSIDGIHKVTFADTPKFVLAFLLFLVNFSLLPRLLRFLPA